jgi:3-oxoacyl-[acyl-carrier-protein] synthase I
VGQLALGNEPSGVRSERWSEGVGLMDALRPLVSGGAGRWVLCNLNGESYGAREWGLIRTRLAEELASVEVVTHPAHCIGDAGTAMAGVLVAYASQAFARGFAPAPSALLWVASDDGGRAALVLHAP